MAVTGVYFAAGPVSLMSLSAGRFKTRCSSTDRLTSLKCLRPPAVTVRPAGGSLEKIKDGDGAVMTSSENPYAFAELARPEHRKSLRDFLEQARDFVRSDGGDGGPPRWFSPVDCGISAPDSPLLLFLPGIDGTGLGLIRHHRRLGEYVWHLRKDLMSRTCDDSRIFDIWCLHIPVRDRTPVQGLVKLIGRTVRSQNYLHPNRPIYIVGESVGACLALDVAAHNPDVDLVLILANPAMHFNNFMLQPLSGLLEFMPDGVPTLLEETLGFKPGDPLKMALDALTNEFALQETGGWLLGDFFAASLNLPTLARICSKDTLLWKLEMLKSASVSANSHIHAVRAQTLILFSGQDQWLLNQEAVERLHHTLPKSEVRNFKENGQFLFLEDGIDLVTIIKGASFYRRGKYHDYISDYIPPTPFEFKQILDSHRWLLAASSPVMLSTLDDGTLVKSLAGIPSDGPVLYVGYHMLLGFELVPLAAQFLRERNILLRGMAHPLMFMDKIDSKLPSIESYDSYRIMGAVPVSASNFYKLLSSKAHVLLYPGGAREALHRKGEEYKLFWPEHPEFVRAASRVGAKIVPFGVIGEDDLFEVVLDYNDQMKIPFLKTLIEDITKDTVNLRAGEEGEVGNQDLYLPGIMPKIPGRFYYYFGKPIETAGKEKQLRDKEKARELYIRVKSEVEHCIAYLKTKRESDPFRNVLPRLVYQASHGFSSQVPTFDL